MLCLDEEVSKEKDRKRKKKILEKHFGQTTGFMKEFHFLPNTSVPSRDIQN